MGEFIAQYWLEVLFGLIMAGFGIFCKKYYQLAKESIQSKKDDFLSGVKEMMANENKQLVNVIDEREKNLNNEDTRLQNSINHIEDDIQKLTAGMLSIQGKSFKNDCRLLLEDNHHITLAEYESIAHDYRTYKGLGGNSNGDGLFDLVKLKYENQLKDD